MGGEGDGERVRGVAQRFAVEIGELSCTHALLLQDREIGSVKKAACRFGATRSGSVSRALIGLLPQITDLIRCTGAGGRWRVLTHIPMG